MQDNERQKNLGLWIALGVLCLTIMGLTVAIIVVFYRVNDYAPESPLIAEAVEEQFADYEGEIADSAKALALSETIESKLSSDPDYNPEQAVQDYDEAYQSASGNLKIHIATYYANYIYETFGDAERALAILEPLDNNRGNEGSLEIWAALAAFYGNTGDTERAKEYQQKIDAVMPGGAIEIDTEGQSGMETEK